MCGLLAVIRTRGDHGLDTEAVLRACRQMAHRGPDNAGVFIDRRAALGHRRLSILDLSSAANQPMRDGELILTYNGEVFNYIELRDELEARGHAFRTRSDSEVILKAYREWGADCTRRFNGMFALVIWDETSGSAFVARDRLGIKPLFWRQSPEEHAFASDLKALWELYPLEGDLDSQGLVDCLVNGFFVGERTVSKGIQRFPPAHHATIAPGRPTRLECYWDAHGSCLPTEIDFQGAVDQTEELLRDAVRLRLRSDVPVGCFLSGGIDSSLVTVMASEESGQSLHTFSIGVDSSEFDESHYARQVATRWDTQHHHLDLDVSSLDALPAVVWAFSEPFGDSSALPAYHVSREAAQHLTVVFSGDGGDEAYGGYLVPYAFHLADRAKSVPLVLRRAAAAGLGSFRLARWRGLRRLARFADLLVLSDVEAYPRTSLRSVWGSGQDDDFTIEYRDDHLSRSILRSAGKTSADRVLYAELQDRFVNDYLAKLDLSTMAHSLEGRSPFLDYRVMEAAFNLPPQIRYHRYRRKAVLKGLARRYFDDAFVDRPKMGFSIPLAQWLAHPRYRCGIAREIMRPTVLGDLIRPDALRRVVSDFERDPAREASRVWMLLWFQIWEGLFVSRRYRASDTLSEICGADG